MGRLVPVLLAVSWLSVPLAAQTVIDVDGELSPDPAYPAFRLHRGSDYPSTCSPPEEFGDPVDHPGHLCTARLHDEVGRAVRVEIQAFGFKTASRNRPVRPGADTIRIDLGAVAMAASELPRVWQVRSSPAEGQENFTLSLRNPRERPVLIERMRINGRHDSGVACYIPPDATPAVWSFSLSDTLHVSGQAGETTELMSAVAERTPETTLAGLGTIATPVTGQIRSGDCGDYSFTLEMPTAIALPEDRTGTLVLSVPDRFALLGQSPASPSISTMWLHELYRLEFFLDVADPEELDMLVECGGLRQNQTGVLTLGEGPDQDGATPAGLALTINRFRDCETVRDIRRINNFGATLRVNTPAPAP